MSLKGFEHTFPANERLHTLALDRAASESRLTLNQLFKDSNSVFEIFDIIIDNINQNNFQVIFVYIFHELFLSSQLCR